MQIFNSSPPITIKNTHSPYATEHVTSPQSELLIKQAKAVLLSPHEPAHNLRVAAHQRCRPTIGQAKTATPTSTNLTEVRRKPGTAPLGLDDVERLKLSVNQMLAGIDTKQKSMHGLSFPFTPEVVDAVGAYQSGKLAYVRMKIDIANERIAFDQSAQTLSIGSLPKMIPISGPRYHLYRYEYVHGGTDLKNTVFIYSMPGYNVSVKERMLYSSCKFKLIENLRGDYAIDIAKTFEIETGDELSKECIESELHPSQTEVREKFSKPKGPATRGPRRLIKGTNV